MKSTWKVQSQLQQGVLRGPQLVPGIVFTILLGDGNTLDVEVDAGEAKSTDTVRKLIQAEVDQYDANASLTGP